MNFLFETFAVDMTSAVPVDLNLKIIYVISARDYYLTFHYRDLPTKLNASAFLVQKVGQISVRNSLMA